ncbi:hypothetical protein NL676_008267 [Syzygium grande]|nr:hypothetical protein NL676_008267 [Syzygium grande]
MLPLPWMRSKLTINLFTFEVRDQAAGLRCAALLSQPHAARYPVDPVSLPPPTARVQPKGEKHRRPRPVPARLAPPLRRRPATNLSPHHLSLSRS